MSNAAKLLGISEEEYIRRYGEPLDKALQEFRDSFRTAMLVWLINRPEILDPEVVEEVKRRVS